MRWFADADRRLRDQGVELAAIAATALLAPFVPLVRGFAVYVFLYFLVVRTRSVRRQFYEPELTDWLRVLGGVTRERFARWYLRDLAVRGAAHAGALTVLVILWRRRDVGGDPLDGLPLPAGVASVLAVLFGLQVALRGAFGIWRHLGSCTWVPPSVRGAAIRATAGPARQLAFLQDALVLALLLTPLVASLALRAYWGLGAVAIAYMALLFLMVADSEAVEASGNPPLSLRELLGKRGGAVGLPTPSRSTWRAVLWTGLRPSAQAAVIAAFPLLGVIVLTLVVDGTPLLEDETVVDAVRLILWLQFLLHWLVLFAVACFAAETPFRWQSRGPTAEYLHACGVDFGRQRRVELAAGAVLCLPIAAVASLAVARQESPVTASMFLPGVALLFARCIRDTLPFGTRRVEVRRVAAWIGAALIAFWATALMLEPRFLERLDQRPDVASWLVAPFVLAALALWLRAWIRGGDEGGVKLELEHVEPAGGRAGGA